MYRDSQWRMQVMLSIASRPGKIVEKQTSDGTLFRCEAIHFEGEGLVEVFQKSIDGENDISVQFSIYGEALAILTFDDKRERLFYERDMGYGSRDKADELALDCLKSLEATITEEEAMAYCL